MSSFRTAPGRALIALALVVAAARPCFAAPPAAPQFKVQAGAFRVEAFARERCGRLAATGLPVALTVEQRRGSPMFLCRSTGRFSRPEAEALAARVRAAGTQDVGLVVAPPGETPKKAQAAPERKPAPVRKAESAAASRSPSIAPALRAEFKQFLSGHKELLQRLPRAPAPVAAAATTSAQK